MSDFDLIVIGAGAAGSRAAMEATKAGAKILLLDEQAEAGGQVWRAKSPSIISAPKTPETIAGDKLRSDLKLENILHIVNARVWQIEKNNDDLWNIGYLNNGHLHNVTCKAIIAATGAQERVIPVTGSQLPGVIGLAAATALFKQHLTTPGKQTIVAGCGPLLIFTAYEILRLGGKVCAIISLNSKTNWAKASIDMMTRPDLLWRGATWFAKITAARIPIYWQSTVTEIIGETHIESVNISAIDANWSATSHGQKNNIKADSLCMGHGLNPAIEATKLADATHIYSPELGGWHVKTDDFGRTDKAGLYAAGDNAGIYGAGAAPYRGKLAAIAALQFLNIGKTQNTDKLVAKMKSAAKFGLATTKLTILRKGMIENTQQTAIICRCEAVSRQQLEAEISSGAHSPNAIKSGTRCGMGPCGGRYCNDVAALINQTISGKTRQQIGLTTSRPPIRPLPISAIAQNFDYDDLPIPAPAPL
ncbi:MAG: FAD-dependent oxidoreductase [Alphaproteobacteria bacterium]|nr:FAD-dependent oxidoreductase [Alphaproteobacteria bacterium]